MDDFVVGKNAEEEVGGDFDETFIPLIEGKEVFFGESSIPCAKIRNSEVIMSGSNLFTRVIKSLKQDGSKEVINCARGGGGGGGENSFLTTDPFIMLDHPILCFHKLCLLQTDTSCRKNDGNSLSFAARV